MKATLFAIAIVAALTATAIFHSPSTEVVNEVAELTQELTQELAPAATELTQTTINTLSMTNSDLEQLLSWDVSIELPTINYGQDSP